MHSPKNDKGKALIRVFNDTYAIGMLTIIREDQFMQLVAQNGDADNAIMRLQICPGLTYHAYNEAINSAATHFGFSNSRFMTNGAHIGAVTAQFAKTRDINAIKLAGAGKAKSQPNYIRNCRAAIAAIHIIP